jgi:hypothetical protein
MNNKLLKFFAFIFLLYVTHASYAAHDDPSDLHEILGDDWRFQNVFVDKSLKNIIKSLENFDIKYNIINPAHKKRLYIYHASPNDFQKQIDILNTHKEDPDYYEVKTLVNDISTATEPTVKKENFYVTSETTIEELLGPHYKSNNIFVSAKLPNLMEKLNNENITYESIRTPSPMIYKLQDNNKKFIVLLEEFEYNHYSNTFKDWFQQNSKIFKDDFIFKKIIPQSISQYKIISKEMSLNSFLTSDLNNTEIFIDGMSFSSNPPMTQLLREKLGDRIKANGRIKTVSNLESFDLVAEKKYVFLFKKGGDLSYKQFVFNYFDKHKKAIKNDFTIIEINNSNESTPTLTEEDVDNSFVDNLDTLFGDNWQNINIFIDLKFRNLIEKIETSNKNTSPPFVGELKNRDPLKKTIIVLSKNNIKDLQSIRKFFNDAISTIKQDFVIKFLLNDIKRPASLIIEDRHFNQSTTKEQILGKNLEDTEIFYSFADQEMFKESVKKKLGSKAKPMPQNPRAFNTVFKPGKVVILIGENERELLGNITTYFHHNKNYIESNIIIKKLVGREDVVEHKYISTNNIEDILDHVVDDTYVFFDYDQTLFLPEFASVNGLINKTVDNKISGLMEQIKQKGGQTIVLTNRGNGSADVSSIVKNKDTLRYERSALPISNAMKMMLELRNANINLSKIPYDIQNNNQFQDSARGYFNGILFTNASVLGQKAKNSDYFIELRTNTNMLKPFKVNASDRGNKGLTTYYGKAITALEFLRAANLYPRRIIFIDDGQELTTAFHKVMEEFGYDSVVIEYNKVFSDEVVNDVLIPRYESISRIGEIIKDKKINALTATNLLKNALENKEIDIYQAIGGILDLDFSAEDQKKSLISVINEDIFQKSPEDQEKILDEIMSSGVAPETLEKYLKNP